VLPPSVCSITCTRASRLRHLGASTRPFVALLVLPKPDLANRGQLQRSTCISTRCFWRSLRLELCDCEQHNWRIHNSSCDGVFSWWSLRRWCTEDWRRAIRRIDYDCLRTSDRRWPFRKLDSSTNSQAKRWPLRQHAAEHGDGHQHNDGWRLVRECWECRPTAAAAAVRDDWRSVRADAEPTAATATINRRRALWWWRFNHHCTDQLGGRSLWTIAVKTYGRPIVRHPSL
jgi:hypothetical protein